MIWLFLIPAVLAATAPKGPTVRIFPKSVAPGRTAIVQVRGGGKSETLKIVHRGSEIPTWPCARDARCGLLPLPMEQAPGTLEVPVTLGERTLTGVLKVVRAPYQSLRLKVDPKKTALSPEDEARIERERKRMAQVYEDSLPEAQWVGGFRLPVKGPLTGEFGVERVFNGSVKSTHYGQDFRAGEKTRVRAAAQGRVVFVGELFYAGNLVVLDHGLGVFTGYAHLSRTEVTLHQSVPAGTALGWAGATGRATGPHLHWSVKVNGLSVDPKQFHDVINQARLPKATATTTALGKKGK